MTNFDWLEEFSANRIQPSKSSLIEIAYQPKFHKHVIVAIGALILVCLDPAIVVLSITFLKKFSVGYHYNKEYLVGSIVPLQFKVPRKLACVRALCIFVVNQWKSARVYALRATLSQWELFMRAQFIKDGGQWRHVQSIHSLITKWIVLHHRNTKQ